MQKKEGDIVKRIKLHENILQIITANMRFENYLEWDLKTCKIVNFIQNNYRRRKHKPYQRKAKLK